MARITDRLVVQRADDLIVFMDDATGTEITFPMEVTPNVVGALVYLTGGQSIEAVLRELEDRRQDAERDQAAEALIRAGLDPRQAYEENDR